MASGEMSSEEFAQFLQTVLVGGGPHEKGVPDRPLEMSVWPFDGAVLVSDADVVTCRRHPVMNAQLLISAGQVLWASLSRLRKAAERLSDAGDETANTNLKRLGR